MRKPFRVWQDVYIVGGPELSHPADCCVYLVDAGDLVLIDCGAGDSADRLISNIAGLDLAPEKLKAVIVTHAHIDHIGALDRLRQDFSLQVIAHQLEAPAIESGNGVGAEFYGVAYRSCQVDLRLKELEERLIIGRHEFKAIHIPGHTSGSIAIIVDIGGKKVLFGQDIHGPYYPQWGADPYQARDSLQKLVDLRADILCEGHFGIYQPADEVENYILGYLHQLELLR